MQLPASCSASDHPLEKYRRVLLLLNTSPAAFRTASRCSICQRDYIHCSWYSIIILSHDNSRVNCQFFVSKRRENLHTLLSADLYLELTKSLYNVTTHSLLLSMCLAISRPWRREGTTSGTSILIFSTRNSYLHARTV